MRILILHIEIFLAVGAALIVLRVLRNLLRLLETKFRILHLAVKEKLEIRKRDTSSSSIGMFGRSRLPQIFYDTQMSGSESSITATH